MCFMEAFRYDLLYCTFRTNIEAFIMFEQLLQNQMKKFVINDGRGRITKMSSFSFFGKYPGFTSHANKNETAETKNSEANIMICHNSGVSGGFIRCLEDAEEVTWEDEKNIDDMWHKVEEEEQDQR